MTSAADDGELAHHLLLDYVFKAGIVVAALLVLAVGMVIVWRWAGRN